MSLPQENFDAAVAQANGTFRLLLSAHPELGTETEETLQSWLWGLEAVAAAIRSELATRGDQPVDFG